MLLVLTRLRSLFLMIFLVVWTFGFSIAVISLRLVGGPISGGFWLVKKWARGLCFVSGVNVIVNGLENIPPDGGFLFLFNHTSHYDIPVMFVATPVFPYFGAKSSLFKIPIFAAVIRLMGALKIERNNRTKVMQMYKEAEHRVAKGDVFALAPEGTRCDGGGVLGPFKLGPMFFSINAKMPLVPMVISHCEKIVPKHSLMINKDQWIQNVYVDILPPISPEGYTEETVTDLRDVVHAKMQAQLDQRY